ncbi:MAG: type ISP restriction/modification enzyme, partial [Limisphaerales bacterium]
RNPKWLQDDYVKFIRFAQWRIDKTGEGIVAFITNHGYLDNPTFRGMRQNLMRSFNEIYVYDLHGNAKKQERAPDGGEDKNVFDIQQGVAICLCVKERGNTKPAQVFHADLWGTREAKYKRLFETDVSETKWAKVKPDKPFYLFVPQDINLRAEYEKGWKVTDAMAVNSLGILSKRDSLVIEFQKPDLLARIESFLDRTLSDSECASKFGLPMQDKDKWDIKKVRAALGNEADPSLITKLLYRPFDKRFIYYDENLVARLNTRVMQHFAKANHAFIFGRQGEATGSETWDVVLCSSLIADQNVYRRGGGTVFPLYLYDGEESVKRGGGGTMLMALFESSPGYSVRRANLNSKFIADLTQKLGLKWLPVDSGDLKKTVGPEDVFNYAYAVFHSPTYRERYAEFLKIDFPRLPLTGDLKLFRALAAKGAELV